MKLILHLFKVQSIVINVFNTVKISIFGSTSLIHITETSGAGANYPVDQKYRTM